MIIFIILSIIIVAIIISVTSVFNKKEKLESVSYEPETDVYYNLEDDEEEMNYGI